MPELNTAVVETPVAQPPSTTEAVPLSEQEITDTYLEKRMDGEVDNLPVPPPTIAETIAPPSEPAPEVPDTPETKEIAAVDSYLEERKERKDVKRKARGGKQTKIDERIDQLTKEKAAAEEKAAALEAEKAHTPIPPGTVSEQVAKVEEAKAVAEATPIVTSEPKPRPRMNEFTDADEYHAAMALWAVEERARTTAKTAPPVVEPAKEPEYLKVRKEEFDRFLEKGKTFMVSHPDFNETLQAAAVRGLTISEQARIAITRKAVPEVAYWLAKPENDLAARTLMGMDELEQVIEVGKIAERLSVSPSDFVSNAPTPGVRLTGGNTRSTIPVTQMDTDDYIRMRRQERRGRR